MKYFYLHNSVVFQIWYMFCIHGCLEEPEVFFLNTPLKLLVPLYAENLSLLRPFIGIKESGHLRFNSILIYAKSSYNSIQSSRFNRSKQKLRIMTRYLRRRPVFLGFYRYNNIFKFSFS